MSGFIFNTLIPFRSLSSNTMAATCITGILITKSISSSPLPILPGLTLFLLLRVCLIVSIILFAPIYSSLINTYNKYNNKNVVTISIIPYK